MKMKINNFNFYGIPSKINIGGWMEEKVWRIAYTAIDGNIKRTAVNSLTGILDAKDTIKSIINDFT